LSTVRRFVARHGTAIVVAAFVLLCVVLVASWPPMTFWSPDCAAKFLQMASVRFDPALRIDAPYVGRSYDPALLAPPLADMYYDVRGGELRMVWPELFPLAAHPLWAMLGWPGLFVLPIACGAASVGLSGAIAERIRPGSGWVTAAIVAFASPVVLYSVLFWEHTAAVALGVLALFWMVGFVRTGGERGRWRAVAAGAAVGLASIGVRAEMVLFAGALLAGAFVSCRGRGRLLAPLLGAVGFVAGAAPAWAMNLVASGRAAPSNAVRNMEPPSLGYLKSEPLSIVPHFLTGRPVPPWASWLTTLALAALVTGYLAHRSTGRRWTLYVALTAMAPLGAASLVEMDATKGDWFHGWLAMSPVLALGFLVPPRGSSREPTHLTHLEARRMVLVTTLAYGVLLVAANALNLTPNGFAAQDNMEWGPRYWLAIFPLAAVLLGVHRDALFDAVRACTSSRAVRAAALLLSLGLLLVSVDFLRLGWNRIRNTLLAQADVRSALRTRGDRPLLTDAYITSPLSPEQWLQRPSYYVDYEHPATFAAWLTEATARGLRSFDLASATPPSRHPFLRSPPACDCVLTVEDVAVFPGGYSVDMPRAGDRVLYVARIAVNPLPTHDDPAQGSPGQDRR